MSIFGKFFNQNNKAETSEQKILTELDNVIQDKHLKKRSEIITAITYCLNELLENNKISKEQAEKLQDIIQKNRNLGQGKMKIADFREQLIAILHQPLRGESATESKTDGLPEGKMESVNPEFVGREAAQIETDANSRVAAVNQDFSQLNQEIEGLSATEQKSLQTDLVQLNEVKNDVQKKQSVLKKVIGFFKNPFGSKDSTQSPQELTDVPPNSTEQLPVAPAAEKFNLPSEISEPISAETLNSVNNPKEINLSELEVTSAEQKPDAEKEFQEKTKNNPLFAKVPNPFKIFQRGVPSELPTEQAITETEEIITKESNLDKKQVEPEFQINGDWQEVPEGTVLPNGVEVKMDLSTGKNLARDPKFISEIKPEEHIYKQSEINIAQEPAVLEPKAPASEMPSKKVSSKEVAKQLEGKVIEVGGESQQERKSPHSKWSKEQKLALAVNVETQAYKTVTSITGVKLATDFVVGVITGQGDLADWLGDKVFKQHEKSQQEFIALIQTIIDLQSQRPAAAEQQKEWQEQITNKRKELEQKISQSKHLTGEEKAAYLREIRQLLSIEPYQKEMADILRAEKEAKELENNREAVNRKRAELAEVIMKRQDLSEEQKAIYLESLDNILEQYQNGSGDLQNDLKAKAVDLTEAYVHQRVSDAVILKDVANLSLTVTGLTGLRVAMYGLTSQLERSQKALRERRQQALAGQEVSGKIGYLAEDIWHSVCETVEGLSFGQWGRKDKKGKTKEGQEKSGFVKTMDFTRAWGTLLRGLGMVGLGVNVAATGKFMNLEQFHELTQAWNESKTWHEGVGAVMNESGENIIHNVERMINGYSRMFKFADKTLESMTGTGGIQESSLADTSKAVSESTAVKDSAVISPDTLKVDLPDYLETQKNPLPGVSTTEHLNFAEQYHLPQKQASVLQELLGGQAVEQQAIIEKGGSVSEALKLGMAPDAKIIVINPDGSVLEHFDANLAHQGDKVFKSADDNFYLIKPEIAVKKGDSLQGVYDKIAGHYKLQDIHQNVKNVFDINHDGRLTRAEAKAAAEFWNESHKAQYNNLDNPETFNQQKFADSQAIDDWLKHHQKPIIAEPPPPESVAVKGEDGISKEEWDAIKKDNVLSDTEKTELEKGSITSDELKWIIGDNDQLTKDELDYLLSKQITLQDLTNAGATREMLEKVGVQANPALAKELQALHAEDYRNFNLSAQEFYNLSHDARYQYEIRGELSDSGYKLKDLIEAKFTPEELISGGFSINELTNNELTNAGLRPDVLNPIIDQKISHVIQDANLPEGDQVIKEEVEGLITNFYLATKDGTVYYSVPIDTDSRSLEDWAQQTAPCCNNASANLTKLAESFTRYETKEAPWAGRDEAAHFYRALAEAPRAEFPLLPMNEEGVIKVTAFLQAIGKNNLESLKLDGSYSADKLDAAYYFYGEGKHSQLSESLELMNTKQQLDIANKLIDLQYQPKSIIKGLTVTHKTAGLNPNNALTLAELVAFHAENAEHASIVRTDNIDSYASRLFGGNNVVVDECKAKGNYHQLIFTKVKVNELKNIDHIILDIKSNKIIIVENHGSKPKEYSLQDINDPEKVKKMLTSEAQAVETPYNLIIENLKSQGYKAEYLSAKPGQDAYLEITDPNNNNLKLRIFKDNDYATTTSDGKAITHGTLPQGSNGQKDISVEEIKKIFEEARLKLEVPLQGGAINYEAIAADLAGNQGIEGVENITLQAQDNGQTIFIVKYDGEDFKDGEIIINDNDLKSQKSTEAAQAFMEAKIDSLIKVPVSEDVVVTSENYKDFCPYLTRDLHKDLPEGVKDISVVLPNEKEAYAGTTRGSIKVNITMTNGKTETIFFRKGDEVLDVKDRPRSSINTSSMAEDPVRYSDLRHTILQIILRKIQEIGIQNAIYLHSIEELKQDAGYDALNDFVVENGGRMELTQDSQSHYNIKIIDQGQEITSTYLEPTDTPKRIQEVLSSMREKYEVFDANTDTLLNSGIRNIKREQLAEIYHRYSNQFKQIITELQSKNNGPDASSKVESYLDFMMHPESRIKIEDYIADKLEVTNYLQQHHWSFENGMLHIIKSDGTPVRDIYFEGVKELEFNVKDNNLSIVKHYNNGAGQKIILNGEGEIKKIIDYSPDIFDARNKINSLSIASKQINEMIQALDRDSFLPAQLEELNDSYPKLLNAHKNAFESFDADGRLKPGITAEALQGKVLSFQQQLTAVQIDLMELQLLKQFSNEIKDIEIGESGAVITYQDGSSQNISYNNKGFIDGGELTRRIQEHLSPEINLESSLEGIPDNTYDVLGIGKVVVKNGQVVSIDTFKVELAPQNAVRENVVVYFRKEGDITHLYAVGKNLKDGKLEVIHSTLEK